MRQTDREKKIAGIRLKNVMDEKKVTQADVVKAVNLRGLDTITDQKISDYIHGIRPIPEKVASAISTYLNIDIDFLTDVSSFHAFVDNTYSEYLKSKALDDLVSNDYFKKYQKLFAVYGMILGVYDNGIFELSDNKGFSLRISKKELTLLHERICEYANKLIYSYLKEGDPLD